MELTPNEIRLIRALAVGSRALQSFDGYRDARMYTLTSTNPYRGTTLGPGVAPYWSAKMVMRLVSLSVLVRELANSEEWAGYVTTLADVESLPEDARLAVVQARLGGV